MQTKKQPTISEYIARRIQEAEKKKEEQKIKNRNSDKLDKAREEFYLK